MQALTVDRLKKAQKYLETGKAARAETICRKLLKDKQGYVEIRLTLSRALLAQNKAEPAARFLSEAASAQQDNPALQAATGDLALKLKNFGLAINLFQNAVSQNPDNPDYWYRLSDSLFQGASASKKTDSDISISLQEEAVDDDLTLYDDAIAISTKAIELFPENVPLLRLTGQILEAAQINDAALLCYEKCLPLEPFDPVAHYQWLEFKRKSRAYQEIVDYAKAYQDKFSGDAICNRIASDAYAQLGHYKDALHHMDQALKAAPNHDGYICTKGHCHYRLGEFEKAIECYDAALKIKPDNPFPKWMSCLSYWKLGDLPSAYKGNPFRFEASGICTKFNLKSPLWQGEELESKKLYLWSDQGIGDVFKTASMIREIKHHNNIIMAVQKKCIPLMEALYPDMEIRALPDKLPSVSIIGNKYGSYQINSNEFPKIEEDFDTQISLGTLPEILRPDIAAFEGTDKILQIPEQYIEPFRKLDILKTPNTTKVGLAWSSKIFGDPEAYGYLDLEDLLSILRLPGFEFYNFQYTAKEEEIKEFREKHDVPLYHAPGLDLMDDMLGTAAFNTCMDLFVGPGSTSSDIAGSVGIKCFRYACCHYQDNLGQSYVPWFEDQKFTDIPWGKKAQDYLPDIEEWLHINKVH
ncbi:tetratricopeptide repeat protein [Cohaesibacter gelatinilyticus]|uniref:Tetratricopeptide repeat-containing protein n=1 Tax=Cohaesibacter gelatinilyticus TaxID=372072 RepID=A0A285NH91_9HYPH|nr:tetratricopeptide repeat protein [Cohaesibacter gelatinilyticus]SNZ08854.1 Tetratricopeptide repeat-containing protein [Cohaesibacter gelatinilyticus]